MRIGILGRESSTAAAASLETSDEKLLAVQSARARAGLIKRVRGDEYSSGGAWCRGWHITRFTHTYTYNIYIYYICIRSDVFRRRGAAGRVFYRSRLRAHAAHDGRCARVRAYYYAVNNVRDVHPLATPRQVPTRRRRGSRLSGSAVGRSAFSGARPPVGPPSPLKNTNTIATTASALFLIACI